MRGELHGSVKFLFQPAEELNLGAKKMVELGCLERVDAVFGLHNSPEIPLGTVAVKRGALMAAVDRIGDTDKRERRAWWDPSEECRSGGMCSGPDTGDSDDREPEYQRD